MLENRIFTAEYIYRFVFINENFFLNFARVMFFL